MTKTEQMCLRLRPMVKFVPVLAGLKIDQRSESEVTVGLRYFLPDDMRSMGEWVNSLWTLERLRCMRWMPWTQRKWQWEKEKKEQIYLSTFSYTPSFNSQSYIICKKTMSKRCCYSNMCVRYRNPMCSVYEYQMWNFPHYNFTISIEHNSNLGHKYTLW